MFHGKPSVDRLGTMGYWGLPKAAGKLLLGRKSEAPIDLGCMLALIVGLSATAILVAIAW